GRLLTVMGLALTGVALLRWFEVATLGNIGAWTGTKFFSQNTYGWLFSTFSPFLLGLFFQAKGLRRWGWGLALLALWSVAAVNGSRGSWFGMLAGLMAFLLLLGVAYPRMLGRSLSLFLLIGVFLVLLLAAPERVVGAVSQRFATLQRLDEDKSYAIRQLMIQKGLRLFAQSPLIGVGVYRWTKESVPLDLPRVLSYAPQSHFDAKSSHNSYLAFLAENGLAGSVPFALLLGILTVRGAWAGVQLARRGRLWGLAVYAGFVGMSVHLWALAGLTNTGTWMMYGLVAALIEISHRYQKRKRWP
ncbi:O-antigen ligase family protein, partial [Anaerolinea sp.]|uniref:O-antigen ligase family protein n=1 Tax=Anaerolinea sp. TaxID=1872519 RepID=UPI002ACDA451